MSVEAPGSARAFEERAAQLGLVLPAPWQLPAHVVTSASFIRIQGRRLLVSGHVPLDAQGNVCGPYGKVGDDVPLTEAIAAARRCMLAIFSSVQHAVGSLDAIAAWTVVRGYVNSAPTFNQYPAVMNGASDLLHAVFGPQAGAHARLALGVAGLPFDVPVEIEAELELR